VPPAWTPRGEPPGRQGRDASSRMRLHGTRCRVTAPIVIPAKSGIHRATVRTVETWVPAFGTTIRLIDAPLNAPCLTPPGRRGGRLLRRGGKTRMRRDIPIDVHDQLLGIGEEMIGAGDLAEIDLDVALVR
jgi:hypothetical protein